ncbi:MAG TPA: response regulator transcription factor [Segeticoccus sp.]|uniref:response regulator transcription factor n=1 Tax=Segeticoccus sp. TaxID=2706531 RepID=UPI002D7E610C|nr:response regulator transcription factor [Segeticoccus sp.]HET8598702.1 response regulator transcription factor [Segeticoccus sp.]
MTRVIVVEDHPLFRASLVTLLQTSSYDVVGEAASAAEAIDLASATRPDLAIVDLGLPDAPGQQAISRMCAELPQLRVVVLSMYEDPVTVQQALDAGALGYVLKDAPPAEVVAAIKATELGASVLGAGLARSRTHPEPAAPPTDGLTPRERAVADLIARGLPNRLIAERLNVSQKTVANYVSAVLLKLGAIDRHDAARIYRSTRNWRL